MRKLSIEFVTPSVSTCTISRRKRRPRQFSRHLSAWPSCARRALRRVPPQHAGNQTCFFRLWNRAARSPAWARLGGLGLWRSVARRAFVTTAPHGCYVVGAPNCVGNAGNTPSKFGLEPETSRTDEAKGTNASALQTCNACALRDSDAHTCEDAGRELAGHKSMLETVRCPLSIDSDMLL